MQAHTWLTENGLNRFKPVKIKDLAERALMWRMRYFEKNEREVHANLGYFECLYYRQ